MSNLAANEMFEESGAGADTVEAVLRGVRKLKSQVRHLVIVTNEIFSEAASYEGDTVRYQEYLGENQPEAWRNGRSGGRSSIWNPDLAQRRKNR